MLLKLILIMFIIYISKKLLPPSFQDLIRYAICVPHCRDTTNRHTIEHTKNHT